MRTLQWSDICSSCTNTNALHFCKPNADLQHNKLQETNLLPLADIQAKRSIVRSHPHDPNPSIPTKHIATIMLPWRCGMLKAHTPLQNFNTADDKLDTWGSLQKQYPLPRHCRHATQLMAKTFCGLVSKTSVTCISEVLDINKPISNQSESNICMGQELVAQRHYQMAHQSTTPSSMEVNNWSHVSKNKSDQCKSEVTCHWTWDINHRQWCCCMISESVSLHTKPKGGWSQVNTMQSHQCKSTGQSKRTSTARWVKLSQDITICA